MRFSKTEKKIIKAIVKYRDKAESLADMFNKSHLLEKNGWNIVVMNDATYYLFYRNDLYTDEDEQKVQGLLAELLALLDKLYRERLLVAFPSSHNRPLVVGKENVKYGQMDTRSVDNGKEYIDLRQIFFGWYNKNKETLYYWSECTDMVKPLERQLFSAYHVSQDLIDLVENDFKLEEEIRFKKQQWATWISIAVALFIGLLGVFIK
jgi:hypothetical protein